MDTEIALEQIGRMNVFAISGGRIVRQLAEDGKEKLILPVNAGYKVVVELAADDTYTVSRIMVRGGKTFPKGKVEGVYAEQLGEVAYQASCYENREFGKAS